MSVAGILVNRLRRIVDRYDEKHGLRKKVVFECHSLQRRHDYRRDDFRISLEEPQCPVYLDNRCCGSCDLTPTCQFAVSCNCVGYTKGALGGTDEGYYMRNNDYSKWGRIDENGKFDWDYYKMSQSKERMVPGKYVVVKELEHSLVEPEMANYLKEHDLSIAIIKGEVEENGFLQVEFEDKNGEEPLVMFIHFKDVRHGIAYENKERIIF